MHNSAKFPEIPFIKMNKLKSSDFVNQIIVLYMIIIALAIPYQASANACVLDFNVPSVWNNTDLHAGNWDGFLNGGSFCGRSFVRFVYSLGRRANETGLIFLNKTAQNDCLDTLSNAEKDVFSCGIEKLTRGSPGGCSDYSVRDVVHKFGDRLKSLDEDCKLLGSDGGSNEACCSCLRRWEEMGAQPNNSSNDKIKVEADVCRFTVLVSLMSQRVYDVEWLQSVYNCLGNKSLPIDDQAKEDSLSHKGRAVLIGGVVGIAVVVGTALLILCRKSMKVKRTKGKEVRIDSISDECSCHNISLKEVYSATENLSATNFIGQGIAGKVYKGILSNGQQIAVKHLINDGHMETFVREVTSLAHVKHPNLVALLGHCDGEEECFLVYELCDKGNLSEWLFSKDKRLTWIQRLGIAIDCAQGLSFLHTYPEGCIVHRDIKPTNILICANFRAKLSDFGLSKVICVGHSYVSSEVRGTFGYVDPEYQKNRHVNSSTDVYSFGMVLLQLLSGQRMINMDLTSPLPLSKMAKSLRQDGHVKEFADPKLSGEYSIEAFGLVFKLALSCTAPKQQRPSMEQVVTALEKALHISKK